MYTLKSEATRLADHDQLTASPRVVPPIVDVGDCENVNAVPLIAHIIYRFDVGGLENGLVNLINYMPAARYQHAIICLTEATSFRQRLQDPSVAVFALHKRPGKDLIIYLRLWRLLRMLRPAVVHTRNLGALDSSIIASLAGVPHRLHGEHGWDTIDLHGASRKYRLLRRLCRLFISRYVVVSLDLEAWLKSRVGVPERRLAQIYNGVDTSRFKPAVQRPSRLPPDFATTNSVVIGNVGRMQSVKDPLTLVDAFLELLERTPDARQRLRLIMIGDGPLRAEAQTRIDSASASAIAWLPGARDDVAEILRALDIFALPSLNEGISNTILEAMATALPVVATRVGGNPELVIDGENGILVPPSDSRALSRALQTYLEQPEMRRTHGEAGRRRVENNFSLQAMVDGYLDLYDNVRIGMHGLAHGQADRR